MNPITLDQLSVFVAIVDAGSFAEAARRMNRAQSAITYAIQKLEDLTAIALFDRSTYRPTLTQAGQALLPRARRIVDDVAAYGLMASGIAKGLEAEVSLVVDPFVPMDLTVEALRAFHAAFPTTQVRIATEQPEAAVQALVGDWADVAIMPDFFPLTIGLERNACGVTELVAVAAPGHPLARLAGLIEPDQLRDHVQLVLSSRSMIRNRPDYGVVAVDRWYLTDLETKHAMLRAGLGWGSMPRERVSADLQSKRLVELRLVKWDGLDEMPRFPFVVAHRKDKPMGPASRWLIGRLTEKVAPR